VAEEHVVELVHHEHEEMGVGLAVLGHEPRVDAEHGAALAGDGRGGHVFARLDAEEREQRAQGVAAGGDGIEHAADEGVGFGSVGHRDSSGSGKKRTVGPGSTSESSGRRDGR
jgi:hypothetical protein